MKLSYFAVMLIIFMNPVLHMNAQQYKSIKKSLSVDCTPVFAQQMKLIEERKGIWLSKAEEATPPLLQKVMQPVAIVMSVKDTTYYQGWKMVVTDKPESIYNKPLKPGDSFILDFGEHFVGYLEFSLRRFDIAVDAPVRLSLIFGEMPAEVSVPFDPYTGLLSRSWLQDEVVNIDAVPQSVRLPRRYAFRYVKVSVVAASKYGLFGFSDIRAESVTSADEKQLSPFTARNEDEAMLDRVSLRTLRDCMQTVFEDAPKRDRRLWMGDTWIQARSNYVSYRNYDLVKRCMYLLAGTTDEQGLVATNVFEKPMPMRGGDKILDYTALFAPMVLEYLEASGDRETAMDLWPCVLKQVDFTLEMVNTEGLFILPEPADLKGFVSPPSEWWLFVDWQDKLDRQASEHAIVLYGLKATLRLAEKLNRENEAAFISEIIPVMEAAAQKNFWDKSLGLFVSGTGNQVSWASQAWMILAGVATREQGIQSMTQVMKDRNAITPVTPYMHFLVVDALMTTGLEKEGFAYLHTYWGEMIRKGAETFWEVYIPGDDFRSPYNNFLVNSACHGSGTAPTYFLRKQKNN